MPSWRHLPYLGGGRRTCRSALGSCVHFSTTCFWGVESNRTLEGYEICQVFLSIEPLHYPNWKKGKWFAVNDKQKLKQSMDQQLPLVASNFPFQWMEMGISQWGEGQLNRNSLFLKLSGDHKVRPLLFSNKEVLSPRDKVQNREGLSESLCGTQHLYYRGEKAMLVSCPQ